MDRKFKLKKMSELSKSNENVFERIKLRNSNGVEFWSARDLQLVLEYAKWQNFVEVIEKAKEACKSSKHKVSDHFTDVSKMVELGSGAKREIDDVLLSRYACYLIVQNGDPSKLVIANGQTYFAIQTRRQELADEAKFAKLSEDERRLMLRKEMAEHNKQLVDAAKIAGIESTLDYAVFQNHGYKGLYGGLDAGGIHKKKSLDKKEKILDNMGSTELAANLFRATQTEEKLRKENILGKHKANQTHYEVGKKVRQTIKELGGTMPENLPTPEKSIKQLEKEKTKILKDSKKKKQ